MNIETEMMKMHLLSYGEKKQTVAIAITPKLVPFIDEVSKKLNLSRGDFLIVCMLKTMASFGLDKEFLSNMGIDGSRVDMEHMLARKIAQDTYGISGPIDNTDSEITA